MSGIAPPLEFDSASETPPEAVDHGSRWDRASPISFSGKTAASYDKFALDSRPQLGRLMVAHRGENDAIVTHHLDGAGFQQNASERHGKRPRAMCADGRRRRARLVATRHPPRACAAGARSACGPHRPRPPACIRAVIDWPRAIRSRSWARELDEYIAREVLPHVSDAWVDGSKTKIGCKTPLNRHLYEADLRRRD